MGFTGKCDESKGEQSNLTESWLRNQPGPSRCMVGVMKVAGSTAEAHMAMMTTSVVIKLEPHGLATGNDLDVACFTPVHPLYCCLLLRGQREPWRRSAESPSHPVTAVTMSGCGIE